MGVQRRTHRPVERVFPADFPERLARFQQASRLSTRALAGLLGVSPYRLRRWKLGGVDPDGAHLFQLLTIAEGLGMRDGILMRPECDLPEDVDLEALRRYANDIGTKGGGAMVIDDRTVELDMDPTAAAATARWDEQEVENGTE